MNESIHRHTQTLPCAGLIRAFSAADKGRFQFPSFLTPLPSAPAPFFSKAAQRRSSTALSLEPSAWTSSSRTQKRPLASAAPPPGGRRTWREIHDTLRSPDPQQMPVLGFSSPFRTQGS